MLEIEKIWTNILYEILRFWGMRQTKNGEFEEALKSFQKTLEISQNMDNQRKEAQSFINIGRVFGQVGKYDKGIQYQHQALEILEALLNKTLPDKALKLKELKGKALGNLGICFAGKEDYEQAANYLKQADSIFKEIGSQIPEAMALLSLGNIYTVQGHYHQAITCRERALEIAQKFKNHQLEGNIMGGLGGTYAFLEDYPKSLEYWQQTLKIADKHNQIPEKSVALANIGFTLLSAGNLPEAETQLYQAINVRESLRTGLSDTNQISIFDTQVDAYQALQQVLIKQEKIQEALEIAERGRARAFIELLLKRLSNSRKISPQTDFPTIEQIQQIAQNYHTTIVEYSIIKDCLKDSEGKYHYRESELLIWVINSRGEVNFQQVDLKPLWSQFQLSLSDLVSQTRQDLGIDEGEDGEKSLSDLSSRLYQHLIQPIVPFLPSDPNALVIFIPQGSLFLLPFPALQDATGEFLIEKHTLLIAPSIQVLDVINQRQPKTQLDNRKALVVGNPLMPSLPREIGQASPLPQLPDSGAEALAIADLLKTEAIMGYTATKVRIVKQMSQAGLIHLATHGLLEEIDQSEIPGVIALAPSDHDRGFLTAAEIFEMKLEAELMILSACQTGRGKITGDGVVGLSRCSMAAGVSRLIVSLWKVKDISTPFLMLKFHEILTTFSELKPGDAAKAFNQAQRWLLTLTREEAKQELEKLKPYLYQSFIAAGKSEEAAHNKVQRRINGMNKRSPLPFAKPRHWATFITIGL